ncbi:unnamed protein product [Spodoptera exigua]|nr:unnamed protein product [Spodoptera exigua]
MYWEQLELRCRSLYRPSAGQAAPSAGRPVQATYTLPTPVQAGRPQLGAGSLGPGVIVRILAAEWVCPNQGIVPTDFAKRKLRKRNKRKDTTTDTLTRSTKLRSIERRLLARLRKEPVLRKYKETLRKDREVLFRAKVTSLSRISLKKALARRVEVSTRRPEYGDLPLLIVLRDGVAECCMNANVSALVGTIENHPESTSESDTGSFTLTRQQRPQPQVGSKRRPRQAEKHIKNQEKMRQVLNNSIRLTEHQIEQLNNSMRMNERMERERMSDRMNETRLSERINDSRDRLNDRERIERMNDCRISDRMNETRLSERMNDSRDRLNEGRVCERERMERLNDSRISDRMNETRMSERMNETRMSERMNDSRDRLNDSRNCEVIDPRIERMNDSRISDRMNETRISERMNDSRVCERMNEARMERMNDSKLSDRSDTRHSDRMNDSRLERLNDSRLERMSEMNSSIRIDGSPKMRTHISPLRIPRSSPKNVPKDHPRQSSSDSNKPEFRQISPLSPNTEESLLSDDDRPQDQVYSNDPETSKCLGPDSQYEPVRESKEEILKTNHHHCYSDTNTMDSGWQSGSEKQVTD